MIQFHIWLSCVSHKLRLLKCWVAFLFLSFFQRSKLWAFRKVGAPLLLRLVYIKTLSCDVDLFSVGVDSIRLDMLRYYSIYYYTCSA